MTSVLIADAQRMFADALARSLTLFPDLEVVEEQPTSGPAAVEAAARLQPDVAVLDFWMGGMGLEAPAITLSLRQAAPRCKVVVVAWLYAGWHIDSCLQAGVACFLPKSLTIDYLVDAIRRAHAGETLIYATELSDLTKRIDDRVEEGERVWVRLRKLTKREIEILVSLSEGKSVIEIANTHAISVSTTRNHIHKILEKTETRSQLEAVALARLHNLIP